MIKVHLIYFLRYSLVLGSLFQFVDITRGSDYIFVEDEWLLDEDDALDYLNIEKHEPFDFFFEGYEIEFNDYSKKSKESNIRDNCSSDSKKRKATDELRHIQKRQQLNNEIEEYNFDDIFLTLGEDLYGKFNHIEIEENIDSQILSEINNNNEKNALNLLNNTDITSLLESTDTNILLLAAQHGMVDIIQYCFENYRNLALITKDSSDKTAMHFACIEGHLAIVKYLFEHHSDLLSHKCNLNFLPLEYAIDYQKNDIIDYFSHNNPIVFFQGNRTPFDTLINFCMRRNQHNILLNILVGCIKNKTFIQSQHFKDAITNEIDSNFIEYISTKTVLSFQEKCVIYLLVDLAPYTAQADVISTIQKNPYLNKNLILSFKNIYFELFSSNIYRESFFIKNLIDNNILLRIIHENEFNDFHDLIKENISLEQNDFFLSSNHLALINDFDGGNKGKGVNVIVCDSFAKPPKESNLKIYNKLINNNTIINENNNSLYFENYNYPINAALGAHGIMVSGVITNDISGIAPNAGIIPVQSFFMDKIPDQKFNSKVINMSISIFERDIILLGELCKNNIVVLSAGNFGQVIHNYYQSLIKSNEDVRKHLFLVSNIMKDGVTLNPMSSYFSEDGYPDQIIEDVGIAAPGTDIVTCLPENSLHSYTVASGTSFSAPIVTGAIAKLMSDFPTLSITEIANMVRKGANNSGVYSNRGKFGCGLLDIKNTYLEADKYIRNLLS